MTRIVLCMDPTNQLTYSTFAPDVPSTAARLVRLNSKRRPQQKICIIEPKTTIESASFLNISVTLMQCFLKGILIIGGHKA